MTDKHTFLEVFTAMMREADYQDQKRKYVSRPVPAWILIMRAELAEAEEAWVQDGSDAAALEEILQVMTVGLRCLCQHGIVERQS